MISYLKHNEINKKKWDVCINKSSMGSVYALSWYLDAVHPGWEAIIEDDYETVFPLTGGKKYGINYLYQPFFNQKLGVFSTKTNSKIDIKPFIEAIPDRFRYADIKLNMANNISDVSTRIELNTNIELDLSSDIETLRRNYSDNTRRNLRKFNSEKIGLNKENNSGLLISKFRSGMGRTLPGIKDKHYARLKKVMDTALKKEMGIIKIARNKGEFLSGAYFLTYRNRLVFLFSANTEEGKAKRAMFGIIDRFIEENSGEEMILDFEGSNNKDLARFYRGFGGKEYHYPGLKINRLPFIIRWIKK